MPCTIKPTKVFIRLNQAKYLIVKTTYTFLILATQTLVDPELEMRGR